MHQEVVALTQTTKQLGQAGEAFACAYLENKGWSILARNWRCREGEIDIVALDGRCVVIVEVKTRRSTRFGRPIEAVTDVKLRRLRGLGARFAKECEVNATALRVDVIGLEPRGRDWRVDHRRGVLL